MVKLHIYVKNTLKKDRSTRWVRRFLLVWKRVKSLMALRLKELKSSLVLHRCVPLRQRYIMSKSGGVRIRYRCMTALFVMVFLGFTALSFLSSHSLYVTNSHEIDRTMVLAAMEPQSGDEGSTSLSADMRRQLSESMRLVAEKIRKKPPPLEQSLTIGSGQTIAGVLQTAGLGGEETVKVLSALKKKYDPRNVKAGQVIDVRFRDVPSKREDESGDSWNFELAEFNMKLSPFKEIIVKREGEKLVSKLQERALKDKTNARYAEIQTSVYGSAAKAGIPSAIVAKLIRTYAHNVDFQRDIRRGDKIEVLYESKETEDGEFAKLGNVLYANLTIGGRSKPIYRFKSKDGRVDYYHENGKSIKKTLLRTPVDGARMSSGYGMRRHPILGYNKMHKGIDFAASTGTPIYAAGDGTLSYVGRKGGYGNYMSIRHNGKISTAYAHLHRFAKGMRKGKRVKQGQLIGYVGSTGRSTGPHLHYEVLVNGKQVNPRRVDLPTGHNLTGQDLKNFKAKVRSYSRDYASRVKSVEFASAASKSERKTIR